MTLFKKLLLALFVSMAMIATAPVTLAAGKTENQTTAETVKHLDNMVALVLETQAAMTSADADRDSVLALFKKTKQEAKAVQSSVVLSVRDRGLARLTKARSAYKKGKMEEAKEWMTKAVTVLTAAKDKFHNF
jgi:anti-sigma factor ChrR (cupin superfamily)